MRFMGVRGALRRLFRSGEVPAPRSGRPIALVYRGPASIPGCSEAVAALLKASRWGFDVRYTGPHEEIPLSAEALADATVYAQPGGGDLARGYRRLRRFRGPLRDYVARGGRYLGFCLGGYLAGATPGFALLPGDTDQYIGTPDATVRGEEDTLVDVRWRGRDRTVFFQDGPCFLLDPGNAAHVLATYPNGAVAALVTPYGAGRVGVVGPHPEATDDWFTDAGLPVRHAWDLGLDLVDAVMIGD
ncbi:BPL-N domain-containing protein [Microbispora sp. H11081]|uniref:BPL-N domain-containing protein n=1 Tax=Microbispora sp. H11081 TaxID=2729107 RepID=UPI001B8CF659|nr:BPL-N domain-containing protein [Microbispora sp. H11081]